MWKSIMRRVVCMAAAWLLAMLVFAPSVLAANPGAGGCDVCTTRVLDVGRHLAEAQRPDSEVEPLVIIVRPQRPTTEPEPLVIIVRPQRPDSEVEPLVIIVRPQRPTTEPEPL